jgi:predicted nucleic acid-binding protein
VILVLDASAAVELVLGTALGQAVAERLLPDLVTPELLDVEVLSALARLARTGEVSAGDASAAAAAAARLPATRVPHLRLVERAWDLRDRVRVADAFYVACAEQVRAPLLTCDGRLAAAPLPGVDVLLVR